MQIFAGNPRNWFDWVVSDEQAHEFDRLRREAGIHPLIVHAPYLINPAAGKTDIRNRSILSTIHSVKIADRVAADAFVVHTGSSGNTSRRAALDWVAAYVQLVLEASSPRLMFCLENMAGTGSQVGSTIDELAKVLELNGRPENLGICLDTAHAHGAGYDLTSAESIDALIKEIDGKIGIKQLGAVHANDSKFELGSHRDRHEHIGEGYIGIEGFRALINHPKLCGLPCILETPGEEADDIRNATLMRSLRERELK